MTEEQMLEGCLANDASAQEALYGRFSPRMLGVCYRFARSREDAEDMMQEGFIKVFSQIRQLTRAGIGVYACASLIQAKQIVECIRLLPLGYRTVLNLYAIEGYSHREIASILDIEESTSRSQYTRAKSMLEDILLKNQMLHLPRQKVRMVSGSL